ncbi:hypothetical protein [Nostoc sp. ChiSLP03a]|uniref:hypothetical protein n=1 Tax=Nostoc sp. ChiSLP03a TaxID=3075380 RepID=UPI002AD49DFA|nr:hypothetical protein [Nostoc sp. ChiSLP03a]MDZ8211280.1 hypothetical protein [Nostoc sp. ChiSLP03a]
MVQPIEDANNNISPQIKAQFSSFIEPFFSQYHRDRCYPGLIFRQGKRTMLQINVPASDFSGLLQAKHPPEMILILVKTAQRLKVMLMKLKNILLTVPGKKNPGL